MKTDRNRRENRKALKVFIPIILAMACFGGIIGYLSKLESTLNFSRKAGELLEEIFYIISPYGVVLILVVSLLSGRLLFRQARRMYQQRGQEEEELLDEIEGKVSASMMVINVGMIGSLMFFSLTMPYIEKYIENSSFPYLAVLAVFVLGSVLGIRTNQLQTDFIKTINPKMKGSVYDIRFREKWEESCDELEKLMIYKAGYKAYLAANTACGVGWIFFTLLSLFLDYGPLPIAVICGIWLTLTLVYYRESRRLEHEKINE